MEANDRHSESLFETQTKGRVYAVVGGNDILKVIYYDNQNKRTKQIDLNHVNKGMKPHSPNEYNHNENDSIKGASNLTTDNCRKSND